MLLFVALSAALLASCSQPDSVDRFVRASKAENGNRFSFTVDMSDTTATYDLTIYTRLTCSRKHFSELEDALGMGAVWMSPDSVEYREFFCIPKASFSNQTSFSHSYRLSYRSGLIPVTPGVWDLSFVVLSEAAGYLDGIGLTCRKNIE